MNKRMLAVSFFVLTVLAVNPASAWSAGSAWSPKEMGVQHRNDRDTEGIGLTLDLLPGGGTSPSGIRCDDNPACKFEMTFFLGAGFDSDDRKRLNILFIAGGPGAIVNTGRTTAALRLLENNHNVVYFHPRGAGQSAIDGDTEFDQFLRAGYIADDLERLRQNVLEDRPWDAVYGHSWGTVVAQRYAAKYGTPKAAVSRVKSLILSAPVDRHRSGNQGARTQATLENLKLIFTHYRTKGAAKCQCREPSHLRSLVTDFANPQLPMLGSPLEASDNFCFLSDAAVENIVKQLASTIADMEENYASADFVVDHFEALSKDGAFSDKFGKYPIEFFAALRLLQGTGAPEPGGLIFSADSRKQINAALLITHALTAEAPNRCSAKDEVFRGASADCEYCARLKSAKQEIAGALGGRESQRMSYVNGLYDGVARWLPAMMGEKGCFKAASVAAFANQSGDDKRLVRDQAKRIGIVAEEIICPWDPSDFRHEVPTLLLKGSRDAIIAGCQAEDFFTNGVASDRRVLLEFAGLGHDMSVANLVFGRDPSFWSQRFANLLTDFIKTAPRVANFRSSSAIRARIARLKATDRTRDPNIAKQCGKIS